MFDLPAGITQADIDRADKTQLVREAQHYAMDVAHAVNTALAAFKDIDHVNPVHVLEHFQDTFGDDPIHDTCEEASLAFSQWEDPVYVNSDALPHLKTALKAQKAQNDARVAARKARLALDLGKAA